MKDFLLITAFMDTGDKFRRRNLGACIARAAEAFPEADHIIMEQGDGTYMAESGLDETPGLLHSIIGNMGHERFWKTRLMNLAVTGHPGYSGYIMLDADVYLTRPLAEYLMANIVDGRLVFPYGDTMYLDETDTRQLVETGAPFGGSKDHGVTIHRQTGLCCGFTWNTFNAVGKFDEAFDGWGAEDDTFMFKFRRIGAEILRNPCTGAVAYHMFHPKVNTEAYQKGKVYVRNRVMCACVRRMSDEDFASFIAGKVTMDEMVEKYRAMGRLEVELKWWYSPSVALDIDTTIYDIDRSVPMTMDLILSAVHSEDGDPGLIFFVDNILRKVPQDSLTEEMNKSIDDWYGRAKDALLRKEHS